MTGGLRTAVYWENAMKLSEVVHEALRAVISSELGAAVELLAIEVGEAQVG